MTESASDRVLAWDGAYNVRDLGGLPVRGGGRTATGAVVRGGTPHRLTAAGWAALRDHGVREVLDLRGDEDRDPDLVARPPGLTDIRVPLDDLADREFWARWGGGLDCTPLYFAAFLERFPRRVAAALTAVAEAGPGGLLIHCGSGRDRTGLVVALLLAAAGVPAAEIAADYDLSAPQLAPAWRDLGLGDQNGRIAALIAAHGTTSHDAVVAFVTALDLPAYLARIGLSEAHRTALHDRLVQV